MRQKGVMMVKKVKILSNIVCINYKMLRAYKIVNLNGLIVNLFWMLVQANVLYAFIKHGISDYSPIQGIGYMIITEALLMITSSDNNLGGLDIENLLKTGDIIYYFTKPISLVTYLIGMEIGRILYYLIWRSVPIFIIGCIFLKWRPILSIDRFILFLLSLIMSIILSNLITFLVVMFSLKSNSNKGFNELFIAISLFFSGGLIPLKFFPKWLYNLTIYSPFSSQIYTPVSIFINAENNFYKMIIIEIIWIIIIFIIDCIVYQKERRNLLVQGG